MSDVRPPAGFIEEVISDNEGSSSLSSIVEVDSPLGADVTIEDSSSGTAERLRFARNALAVS